MRTSTLLILLIAVAIGVGLFMVKYRVQDLEDQLVNLNREITNDQEAIHVLKAEWSHLNEPMRLKALAGRHLGMTPVPATNIASRSDINDKIPIRAEASDGKPLENEGPDSSKEKTP
jgi:cell division protein FtsL